MGYQHIQRTWNNPFYVKFKKHSCPQCGKVLALVKKSRIVNSNSPEAKDFDFLSGDTYMIGNVKFIWNEFSCAQCNQNYKISELRKLEKKSK